MKITIVTGFFLPVPPVRGGSTEKTWYRLAQEFAGLGHDVTFVSRMWPGFAPRERVEGVDHLRVRGADHTRSLLHNLWRDFWWGIRVARALPPADITICNTVTMPVWLHRFRPAAGRVVAVIARTPRGQARFYRQVDLFLVLSADVRNALLTTRPSLAAKIAPFPYPIDWQRLAAVAASRVSNAAVITIGFVGRIHPEKGLSLLARAATQLAAQPNLPEWRLLLVGPTEIVAGGGGASYVDRLRAEFGPAVDRVTFAGPEFDAEKLAARYAEIDIFCYPSIAETGETFGVAIAEAMAARCAVVASQLVCFDELIGAKETGLVFDHRSPDAAHLLADRLAHLLRDPGQRHALGERAQAHVRQFDYPAVARSVSAHLHQLVPAAATS